MVRIIRVKGPRTVDPAVTVLIRLADHLVNLVVCKLLSDRSHDVTKLCGRYEAIVVAIEDLECFLFAG